MAYLTFAEGSTVAGQPVRQPRHDIDPVVTEDAAPSLSLSLSLSPLEWLVVAVGKQDRLSSLREPSRLSVALGSLFGPQRNPRLADERLEALRRIAVLSWHYGYVVPGREVSRFIAAGFTPEQYELVVDSIGADRLAQRNERFRR
jgi:hypothetical protein